ncbi:MAG: F0F1 ATP synthase subunit delta [Patescibacteria group bacterium]
MKISPKKYAVALVDVASKAGKGEHASIVEKFFKLLLKKNSLSLLPLIIVELAKYLDQQSGQIRAELFTSHQLDQAMIGELRQFLADKTQAEVILQEHLNKELLGGFVLQWPDFLLDASVKTELKQLNYQLNT